MRYTTRDGKRHTASFGVKTYGYENAFNLAVEWRQKQENEDK